MESIAEFKTGTANNFSSFSEFYEFYLTEHSSRRCRRLHILGTALGPLSLIPFFITGNIAWPIGSIVTAYGLAWFGHFAFEKNKPAAWRYPLRSFASDWVMFGQFVTGKLKC
jgi:hypothetical protein